jgi:hypothetical protein
VECDFVITIFPSREALSADARLPGQFIDRWIEAKATDPNLIPMLRRLAKSHPRWSWKMAHEILLREGWNINKKPTQRL